MEPRRHYASREEQAKAEIGVTAVSRRVAVFATLLFLATIVVVPLIDQASSRFRAWRGLHGAGDARQGLRNVESALADDSRVARAVRPIVQTVLTDGLHSGTDQVYPGRDGWLFYDPDLRHVTGRGFFEPTVDLNEAARQRRHETPRQRDPIRAIADFDAQLRARGIVLVLVPVPVKPTVHPEMLWPGVVPPVENASFDHFRREIASRNILLYDVTPELLAAAAAGEKQFLASDTHWRPEAVDRAAAGLARFVTTHVELPQSLGVAYRREAMTVQGRGDLAGLLRPDGPVAPESVTILPVLFPDGRPWAAAGESEILWLGDSFSNIYSAEPMGWGAAAGFVEQFSYHLGRPVDAIRRNDQGAFATRQMLAAELARGHDRLAGKRLVIWQFAARELSFGDWQRIELKLNARPATRVIVPPVGQTWTVWGVVSEKGAIPRPGSVAYRDHIVAVRLTGVVVDGSNNGEGEAVVYLRSMTDGKLTGAAALQVGQRIRATIRDWSEVSRFYDFIHRSDLPGADTASQPPCWGELLP